MKTKISIGSEYQLIRACGLCRHLICDGGALYDLANKKYKIKLRFEVVDDEVFQTGQLKGYLHVGWATILPNHVQPKTKIVNKSEFLRLVLLYYHQHAYTVN